MSDAVEGIYALDSVYLDCAVQVGIAGGKVISLSFPPEAAPDATTDHPVLDRIESYLEGLDEVDLSDVEVALTVPTDQRAVLETVRTVPYGEQVTVERLARMTPGLDTDDEDVLDTVVRTTLAENPIPLVIPDHRVRDGPSAAPPAIEQKLRSIEGL